MSGWDSWAANVVAAGGGAGEGCKGAVLYDQGSGAIWGKSGQMDCAGGLNAYDCKAEGKDATVPVLNGQTYMFVRKTLDDDPVSIFKRGPDTLFTTKGPSGSRVAVYVVGVKPEPIVNKVVFYLKPHV